MTAPRRPQKRRPKLIEEPVGSMPFAIQSGMEGKAARRATQANFDAVSGQLVLFARKLEELYAETDEEVFDPETPANLSVSISVREKKTHLEYKMVGKCNQVTDEDITSDPERPQVSHYVFQQMACDSGGNAVELDGDSDPVIHRRVVHPPKDGDSTDKLKAVWNHLSRPKTWYRKMRVIVVYRNNTRSVWADWTTPVLPTEEAEPKPPAPTFVSLTFDKKGRKKFEKWRGMTTFTPVRDWDVPGGDQEDDLSRYVTKVECTDDAGATWHKHCTKKVEDKDDGEADQDIVVPFRRVRKKYKYRVYLRSIDRFNRRGDWAGPYPDANGVGVTGDGIQQVKNVVITNPVPRRFVAKWDEPDDCEDVDVYKVEWYQGTTLKDTQYKRSRHSSYRVPQVDKGLNHKAKVYAMDEDANEATGVLSSEQAESGDIVADGLTPGAIGDLTPFAASIRPIKVVSSLPALPDSNYPNGAMVYLTSDYNLYQNDNGSWVRAVSFVNCQGTISASQIAAGTISASHIVANCIDSGQIAAGAIKTDELYANAVTADKMSVSTLSAIAADCGTITAGTIRGTIITTGSTLPYITMDGSVAKDKIRFSSSAGETSIVATGGGIQVGAATGALLGFYGKTPAARPSVTAGFGTSGTDFDGVARGAINDIVNALKSIGLFG